METFFQGTTIVLFVVILILITISLLENTNPVEGSIPDILNGVSIVLALFLFLFLILSSIIRSTPVILPVPPPTIQVQTTRTKPPSRRDLESVIRRRVYVQKRAQILNMDPQQFMQNTFYKKLMV